MYVYRELKGPIYEVGHYHKGPNRSYKQWDENGTETTTWSGESRWRTKQAAAAHTSYLNGGQPIPEHLKQYEIIPNKEQEDLQAKLQAVPDLEPPTTYTEPQKLVDILNTEVLPELKKQAQKIKKELDPTEPIPVVDTNGKTTN